MDFFNDRRDGRSVTALEANVDALSGLYTLSNLERLPGLDNIDAHRFFAVDVLAGVDGSLKMLHMEEWRCRDLDQVDVGLSRKLLECVGAVEEKLAAEELTTQFGVETIEVGLSDPELIRKEIRKCHDVGACVLREGSRNCCAPRTAPEKTDTNCRVRLITKCGTGFD